MARTVAQAVAAARIILNDTDAAGYRYTDSELTDRVTDALNAIRNRRPDLFIGSWGSLTTASGDMPLNEQFFTPVVNYVVGMSELKDDEHVLSGRAKVMVDLMGGFLL
jgi:hypothetical protein